MNYLYSKGRRKTKEAGCQMAKTGLSFGKYLVPRKLPSYPAEG